MSIAASGNMEQSDSTQRTMYQAEHPPSQGLSVEDVSSTQTVHLFEFPREIRDIIYEFVLLPQGAQVWLPMLGGCPPTKRRTCFNFYDPALLRTSKTVYDEARKIFYNKIQFGLAVNRWDCPRTLTVLPRIKDLYIEHECIEKWTQLVDYIIEEMNLRTLYLFSPSGLFSANRDSSLDRLHNAFRIIRISPCYQRNPQWFSCSNCEFDSRSRSYMGGQIPPGHPINWRLVGMKQGDEVYAISFHDQKRPPSQLETMFRFPT